MLKTLLALLAILLLAGGLWLVLQEASPVVDIFGASAPSERAATDAHGAGGASNAIYARVTTHRGEIHEGRLRFGRGEEAFWGDFFNGVKAGNEWVDHVPAEALTIRRPIRFLGITFPGWAEEIDLRRPFMVRFGDIDHIENLGGARIRVQMKSGRQTVLNTNEMGDFDDGVRIWGVNGGVVDIGRNQIARFDFLSPPEGGLDEPRLWAVVETTSGLFEGFIQWNREKGHGLDGLIGRVEGVEQVIGFESMTRIERMDDQTCTVFMSGGGTRVLRGGTYDGCGNRGLYVDDRRFGRVLVLWSAFVRADLAQVAAGPEYDDYPPGLPLSGWVIDGQGNRFEGRIVFDLDEDETTDTLDASGEGVNYSIPFGAIAAIVPRGDPFATVTLRSGEVVPLEHNGDLSSGNGGMLVFEDVSDVPRYVAWADVEQIVLRP